MLNIDFEKCTGCGACVYKCPVQCISWVEGNLGFNYPQIDVTSCIGCGLCDKVCPIEKQLNASPIQNAYAAVNKDKESLLKSTSGGAFTVFAKKILEWGGIVYGAAMSDNLQVKHIRISDKNDIEKLQGSKYLQSDISKTYRDAEIDLKNGLKVLYSGTPCQIDGLKYFLGKNYDNLYTVDIICHGVPSQKLFNEYIKNEESKINKKIISFCARDKSKGWSYFYYYYYYQDYINKDDIGKKTGFARCSSYYWSFLNGLTYRQCCYSCKYACEKRVGDITIGDYWGVEKEHPEILKKDGFDLFKGISCVIVNSKNGEFLFDNIKNDVKVINTEFNRIKNHNAQLSHPSKMNEHREELISAYNKSGYNSIEELYKKYIGAKRIIYIIWEKLPIKVKRILHKFK